MKANAKIAAYLLTGFFAAAGAFAQGISYNPQAKTMQGVLDPGTGSFYPNDSYTLTITGPAAANSTNVVGPVTFVFSVIGAPSGVSVDTAKGYISASTTSFTFNQPSQQVSVTISLAVPAGTPAGSYGYLFRIAGAVDGVTSGWPANANIAPYDPTNQSFTDPGATINGLVSAASVTDYPPVITSLLPLTGSQYTYPQSVPISFDATVPSGGSSITQLHVLFDGVQVPYTTSAITGGSHVTASITSPNAQPHTISVSAQNKKATATGSTTINVNPASQTITFAALAAKTVGDAPFAITATASSGLPVSFTSSNSAVATVSGSGNTSTVTIVGVGTTTITASQAGNTNYTAAPSVSQVLTVNSLKLPQTITFGALAAQTYSGAPFTFAPNATASSGLAVIYSSSNAAVATVSSSNVITIVGAGATTLTANQPGNATFNPAPAVSQPLTVNVAGTLPTVVINTPPAGSVYNRAACSAALSITLSFTGTSTSADAVITDLSATVAGTSAVMSRLTKANLNSRTATGTGTITVSNAGTYTVTTTATDKYGTATATRTFVVTVASGYAIAGTVFFDVNFNGAFDVGGRCDDDHWAGNNLPAWNSDDWDDHRGSRYDRFGDFGGCRDRADRYNSRYDDRADDQNAEDFGLGGVTVTLCRFSVFSLQLVATTTTAADGTYSFANLQTGLYFVSTVDPVGYDATTQTQRAVWLSTKNMVVRDIGYGLDFDQIRTLCADGRTDAFWYTQLDKCLREDTQNVQVSAADCVAHTARVGSLALTVFDNMSMSTARSCLSNNSGADRDQLARQLLAAEYNYARGAYINGDRTLTYCFIQWGERVHTRPASYSSTYVRWARNWFSAYNTSGGGCVRGPQ